MRKIFSLIALVLTVNVFAPAVSADDAKVKKVVGGLLNVISGATSGASTSTTSTATSAKTKARPDDGKLKATTTLDDLVIKVKSCTANDNDDVIVVFTLDNQTNTDYNGILAPIPTEVYDDEGNVYKGEPAISFGLANDAFGENEVNLPSGIMVKYKMKVKDVDSAASMLKLVKGEFRLGNLHPYSFTLKNVPITREGD